MTSRHAPATIVVAYRKLMQAGRLHPAMRAEAVGVQKLVQAKGGMR